MQIKQSRIYSEFTKRIVIGSDIELVDKILSPSLSHTHSIVQWFSHAKLSHNICQQNEKKTSFRIWQTVDSQRCHANPYTFTKAFKILPNKKNDESETLAERVGHVFITIKFVHFAYLHIDIGARPTKINCNGIFLCSCERPVLFYFCLIFIIYWKARRVQKHKKRSHAHWIWQNCVHYRVPCALNDGYIHHDGLIVNGSRFFCVSPTVNSISIVRFYFVLCYLWRPMAFVVILFKQFFSFVLINATVFFFI